MERSQDIVEHVIVQDVFAEVSQPLKFALKLFAWQ